MANALYPKFKERCLAGGGNLLAGTVRAILVDTGAYTYSGAHEFLSSISAGARVGSAVTLAGKSVTDGVFSSTTNPSFTGLTSAPSIEAIVIYVDSGSEATSPLVAFIDTASGLPVAAGATQVDVTWDTGADKIFRL